MKRIQELEEVILQMKKEKNNSELLSFPWAGNLGNWHWIVQSNEVVFNEKKATNLGYESSEIPEKVGFEYFTEKLHIEDYAKVMKNMRDHLMGVSDIYEIEYRILTKEGSYIWYYDRGKVTKRDKDGKALVVSGIVFDIDKEKTMERELYEANKKLTELTFRDELTGAFNRRFMLKKLNEEIQRFSRTKLELSIILFDIDNFKQVNDNFGHNSGDNVLKKIVKTVEKRIRKTDFLCRWGGEEFIIILPDTKIENATKLAEEIRIAISKMVVDDMESVTASFGVSSCSNGDTVDSIIKKADDLMYKAKSEGKNCVRCI